jgi:tetratricopeptide (TPR) repeat protein
LGHTLLHLGEIETAQAYLERALAIQKETQPQQTETADTLNHLGDLYRVSGNLASAHEMLEQALSMRESVSGDERPDTAHTLISLGELYLAEGDNDTADNFFHRAHSILEAQVTPTHYDLKRVTQLLGQKA